MTALPVQNRFHTWCLISSFGCTLSKAIKNTYSHLSLCLDHTDLESLCPDSYFDPKKTFYKLPNSGSSFFHVGYMVLLQCQHQQHHSPAAEAHMPQRVSYFLPNISSPCLLLPPHMLLIFLSSLAHILQMASHLVGHTLRVEPDTFAQSRRLYKSIHSDAII